ncbi:MAG: hypothetical protein ACI85E_002230, partial [Marinomonas primoryensis]
PALIVAAMAAVDSSLPTFDFIILSLPGVFIYVVILLNFRYQILRSVC